MKVMFMGTPSFAVPTLEMLIHSKHEVVTVVTQPDRPKGRGNKVQASPVKEVALENDINIIQPEKIKNEEVVAQIKKINPDLIVVVAFGQILSKEILDIPKYGCINIHGSLLPKLRGAAPIQWAIVNGETKTGVTIMYMDVRCDTGDIILKSEIDIEENDTAGTIHDKLSYIGADALKQTIQLIEEGYISREKQDDSLATYAPPLDKKMGLIDWSKSAQEIKCLVKGLNPWPSAYSFYEGKTLKIWDCNVIEEDNKDGHSGQIVNILPNEGIIIQTGYGQLLITEVQLQGRKRMMASEFVKGCNLEINDFLGVIG